MQAKRVLFHVHAKKHAFYPLQRDAFFLLYLLYVRSIFVLRILRGWVRVGWVGDGGWGGAIITFLTRLPCYSLNPSYAHLSLSQLVLSPFELSQCTCIYCIYIYINILLSQVRPHGRQYRRCTFRCRRDRPDWWGRATRRLTSRCRSFDPSVATNDAAGLAKQVWCGELFNELCGTNVDDGEPRWGSPVYDISIVWCSRKRVRRWWIPCCTIRKRTGRDDGTGPWTARSHRAVHRPLQQYDRKGTWSFCPERALASESKGGGRWANSFRQSSLSALATPCQGRYLYFYDEWISRWIFPTPLCGFL